MKTMNITDLKPGVYKVRTTNAINGSVREHLAEFSGEEWYFFGNDVDFEVEINSDGTLTLEDDKFEVLCRIDWETPRESYSITSEHPRAQFIVAEIDGKEDLPYAKNLSHINLATHEISVWCENGHLIYEDKDGNKEEYLGEEHVTFPPKQFKAYDRETGIVYAEWNHYENT